MKTLLKFLGLLLISTSLKATTPEEENLFLLGDVIVDKSFKTTIGKTLYFESSAGDIRVYTSDKPEVRIKIYGDTNALDRLDLLYSETSDGMKIKVKKVTSFWGFFSKSFYVDYDLIIPKNYNLVVNSSSANIYLKTLSGNLKIRNSAGDIKIKDIDGNVSAFTTGGDIILGKINGNIEAITTGGDIYLEEIDGDVSCSTTGGDIRIQSKNGVVHANTTGGNIVIDHMFETRGIKAGTVGGDIKIYLDSNFEGYFDLSTLAGVVSIDFQLTQIYFRKSFQLKGEINKSDPKIECRATGGDIRIYKRKR